MLEKELASENSFLLETILLPAMEEMDMKLAADLTISIIGSRFSD